MEDLSRLLQKKDREIVEKKDGYLAELEYFEKVRAHRVYQYAMSRYKLMRYAPETLRSDQRINWQLVDYELRQAMERYNEIRIESDDGSGKKQPLFIDLIIKITVCRAYANLNNKKILTAEKILESTRSLINFIEKGRIQIMTEEREEAPVISIEILKQKYLLHKGYLMIALNKDQDACRCFTHCMVRTILYFKILTRELEMNMMYVLGKSAYCN